MLKIFTLLAIAYRIDAWWCQGHMLVAMLAQIDLSDNDPNAFREADSIVAVLNGSLSHGLSNSFVESGCWADDLKVYNVTYLNNGHFYDMPYNPEGMLDTSITGVNILESWANAISTLSKQTLDSAPFETSFSLRFLIHLAGDIHQPLHCTMLWSSQFPNGDYGGNFFKLPFSSDIKQLHAFWDSGAGQLKDDPVRPLSQDSWNGLLSIAQSIMYKYPRSSLADDLKLKNPADWCLGSYEDAVEYAYDGVTYNQAPSQDYINRAWEVIQRRIALGGYRLSDTISSLY